MSADGCSSNDVPRSHNIFVGICTLESDSMNVGSLRPVVENVI